MDGIEQTGNKYPHQLRGWLAYSFAYEVFAIVSLTLFLPVCLEQFARDNGYFSPEKAERCTSISDMNDDRRCVVKLGWVWVDTASFSLYVYSISVALQALMVISIGGLADKASYRKKLLLTFAAVGSASSILFLPLSSSSPVWPLAGLLAIVANVCFGTSIVANNAYLPSLAKESLEVVEARKAMLEAEAIEGNQREGGAEEDSLHAPLLVGEHPGPQVSNPNARLEYELTLSLATARLSSLGIASGYAAGILLLLLILIPVTLMKGSTLSLRVAIGASGVWWALFSIPAAVWLPGPRPHERTSHINLGKEVCSAWAQLGHMLRWKEVHSLRYTFVYLAAWFLLSDGFTTITSTSVLFAKTTLHMPPSSLIIIGVIVPTFGIIGSLIFPRIQHATKLSNLSILVLLVTGVSLIPIYGCLGFIPIFRDGKVKFGGLTTPGEMYVLAVYFGSLYGAFQGYARAFFTELIPAGEEARWFALFSITDKSSSFLGPLVVGLIADLTGNIRYSFFFLVVMIWAAVPLLLVINVEIAREDARLHSFKAPCIRVS